MNEQMKDGAAVPDNRKWSDQDHRWEYEAQGLLEPEKLADGQDGPEDQAQTIAALTQEVATLKAEREDLLKKIGTVEMKNHLQTIDERDAAEEALSHAYFLIKGESPEWSNYFGHQEALDEIDDAQKCFRAEINSQKDTINDYVAEVDTLKAALATLRSENERLKQPVSDKEWLLHSSCRAEYSARATRHQVDRLIQSRITPPAHGPTSTEEKAE